MKKIYFVLIALFAGLSLFAQTPEGRVPSISDNYSFSTADYYQYYFLLDQQNHLLKNRKTALTLTLVGSAVTSLSTLTADSNGELSKGGAIMALAGSITTLVGGVWLIVNEYQLISSQRRINDHLMLQVKPNGLALSF